MPLQAWIVAFIVLMLIPLPYLVAVIQGGSEYAIGGFLLNPYDGNSNLVKMYLAWRGIACWRLRRVEDA